MSSVLESLNKALHQAMSQDERVYMLGEDILDPYGGAFKVTRGLSESYPERVLTTPISEAGIVGLATGMALRGLRPIVEIMFGDFITLTADQIINHAAKFRWMYNDQVNVPLVIRLPMGGRRGYGPTHSQTLEKHFLGVPGLRVLAPCALGDPGALLIEAALWDDDPVLFVENKLLYLLHVQNPTDLEEFDFREINSAGHAMGKLSLNAPVYSLTIRGAPSPDLTLAAYGYMAELGRLAAIKLAYEHEIFVDLVIPTQLAPFELDVILESADRSGRLLVIEEGPISLGWGAEVIAQTSEALGAHLSKSQRLAAQNLPIPASRPLELSVLPGLDDILDAAQRMV